MLNAQPHERTAECADYANRFKLKTMMTWSGERTFAGWRTEAPKLAQGAEEDLPEGFAVFKWPIAQRIRLRTSNDLERIHREIKYCSRGASVLPNSASCRRLVSAQLADFDEDWMTGKNYLNLEN